MILLVIIVSTIVIVCIASILYALSKPERCPECGARMREQFEDIPESEKEEKDKAYCYLIKTCPNGHIIKEKVLDPSRYFLMGFGNNFFEGV